MLIYDALGDAITGILLFALHIKNYFNDPFKITDDFITLSV